MTTNHPPHTAAIAHHPDFLEYDFGSQHPLRPERITLGMSLLEVSGLWDAGTQHISPGPASSDELTMVHDQRYIYAVQEAGHLPNPSVSHLQYGLGPGDNPPFPHMHEASSLVAGGSLEAARRIMRGELFHAFNPAGGLHHASRDRASGFCIYNDPALAAAAAVNEFGARVMYIDVDCHHGDGVQWIFYHDPRVLTVSFHESGRYLFPGTGDVGETGEGAGRGFSVNLPVAPYTQDDFWIEALEAVLPPLVERFKPDLIVSAHGADTHAWDPLTHLLLSTRSFRAQVGLIHRLAHEYAGGRWLAVGSGGYDWRRVVPRSWAIVWSEMTDQALDERLPEDWLGRWSAGSELPMPRTYDDDFTLQPAEYPEVEALNRRVLERVMRVVEAVPRYGPH